MVADTHTKRYKEETADTDNYWFCHLDITGTNINNIVPRWEIARDNNIQLAVTNSLEVSTNNDISTLILCLMVMVHWS